MSLKITVVDEQTGETETRRVAEGDYAVITAHPCEVYEFGIDVTEKLAIVKMKNFDPQKLREYELVLT
jgi:hypothetical protein